jgi:transposase
MVGANKKERSRAMKEFIALDVHKRYSWMEREEVRSGKTRQARIEHAPGAIRQSLEGREKGTAVAVEATGNWYWIVEEIEQAGLEPKLVHPRKAKLMMGLINKTDKLDTHGLNQLQRNGTLPTVWIPPRELRDLREITRTRMVISRQRTRLKNRVQATLSKYGFTGGEASDVFGKKARSGLDAVVKTLPLQTAQVTQMLLRQLDFVQGQIGGLEQKIQGLVKTTAEMGWTKSLPGIGWILSAVIALEVGTMSRFASAERYASYAGTTPRVHASGDRTRYGRLRTDVNQYLKWAYVEAAHSICLNRKTYPERHVSHLYERICARKGHAKAIGAVARHLAEATFHVWTKQEPYRDPMLRKGQSREV